MKARTVILVFLAIVCGGAAAVGVNQMTSQSKSPAVKNVTIVTAAANIARGTVLTTEALTTRPWPSSALPPGAITDINKAVGRSNMSPLVNGEPLLEAKLASKDAGRGLAAMIPFGMRAFTIRTSHTAAGGAGFIMPGDKVDVLLTMTDSMPDDTSGGGVTTTLLQNIEILAVAQLLDAPHSNKVDTKELSTVTLLVTPDQAAKLDLGMNKGNLHLSLRNAEDSNNGNTRPATMAQLRFDQEPALKAKNEVAAVAPSPTPPPVAVKAVEDKLPVPATPTVTNIHTLRGMERGIIVVERQ